MSPTRSWPRTVATLFVLVFLYGGVGSDKSGLCEDQQSLEEVRQSFDDVFWMRPKLVTKEKVKAWVEECVSRSFKLSEAEEKPTRLERQEHKQRAELAGGIAYDNSLREGSIDIDLFPKFKEDDPIRKRVHLEAEAARKKAIKEYEDQWEKTSIKDKSAEEKHLRDLAQNTLDALQAWKEKQFSESDRFLPYKDLIEKLTIDDTGSKPQWTYNGEITLNFELVDDEGAHGKFGFPESSPIPGLDNPNICVIRTSRRLFEDHYETGQTSVVLHELGHFFDFLLFSERISGKNRSAKAKRNWQQGNGDLLTEYQRDISAELFSRSVSEHYFGPLCAPLRRHSNRYLNIHRIAVELLEKHTGVGKYLDLLRRFNWRSQSTDKENAKRVEQRVERHQQAASKSPIFGGLVLGNKVRGERLQLIKAAFAIEDKTPVIRLTVKAGEKTQECRYVPASSTELWVAYHIVNPTPTMKRVYGLKGVECNLIGGVADPLGRRVEFGIHPALAHTPLAVTACRLDALWSAGAPGLFSELSFQSNAMQWMDAEAVCRLQDGRLMVEADSEPKDILLRARFWGPKSEIDKLKLGKEIRRRMMDELAIHPAGNTLSVITKSQLQRVLDRHALQVGEKAYGNQPIDSGSIIKANWDSYPSLHAIDRFAKTLAVLNWILDSEDVELPKLPNQIRPKLQFVEPSLSLLDLTQEIHRGQKRFEEKAWGAPVLNESRPQNEQWYAIYDKRGRTGWRHVVRKRQIQKGNLTETYHQQTRWVYSKAEAQVMGAETGGAIDEVVTISRQGGKLAEMKYRLSGPKSISMVFTRNGDDLELTSHSSDNKKVTEQAFFVNGWRDWGFAMDSVKKFRPKPGSQPWGYIVLFPSGPWFVEFEPKDYETVDVFGKPTKLLRVDVKATIESGEPEVQPTKPAHFFPRQQSIWIDANGNTIQVEGDRQLPPNTNNNTRLTSKNWMTEVYNHPFFRRCVESGRYKTISTRYLLTTRQKALTNPEVSESKSGLESFPRSVPILKCDEPLISADQIRELVYQVEFVEPVDSCPILVDEFQTVRRIDERTFEVTTRSRRGKSQTDPGQPQKEDPHLLDLCRQPSFLIDNDEERIQQIARSALPAENDHWRIAQELEWLTRRSLVPSYKFPMLPASQALAVGGDCSEHACVLAALSRARGIPAQLVFGLRYADQFRGFVGHVWVEVWANGRWRSVDGTVGRGGLDAVYIKTDVAPDILPVQDLLPNFDVMKSMRPQIRIVRQNYIGHAKETAPPEPPTAMQTGPYWTGKQKDVESNQLYLAAFELGATLGDWVSNADLYGPEHPITKTLRSQVEEAAETLSLGIPLLPEESRSTELSVIRRLRYVLHNHGPTIRLLLKALHGEQVAANFQVGLESREYVTMYEYLSDREEHSRSSSLFHQIELSEIPADVWSEFSDTQASVLVKKLRSDAKTVQDYMKEEAQRQTELGKGWESLRAGVRKHYAKKTTPSK